MKRITSIAIAAISAGLLVAVLPTTAGADAIFCSGYAAGYKAAYCSRATRLSSCDPKGIECDPLGGDGYASGYMDGQRAGLQAAARDAEEKKKSERSGER